MEVHEEDDEDEKSVAVPVVDIDNWNFVKDEDGLDMPNRKSEGQIWFDEDRMQGWIMMYQRNINKTMMTKKKKKK